MKTIKKVIKVYIGLTVISLISSISLNAQKSGVFRTYSDYSTGKMDYGIDCATEKHIIKLNDFLNLSYIKVIHQGKPYKLKKTDIWGYQLCDNKVIRFQGKEHFLLQDRSLLWIYTRQISVTTGSPKTSSTKIVTSYYFSVGGDSKISELTLLNLKSAFPNNRVLHDTIDGQFKSDASLNEYDQINKYYKINHFLESQGMK
jgi:hypothetical protein